jgi:hypothetical protein
LKLDVWLLWLRGCLHKIYCLRTFPILFNKKDTNVVIGCRFVVVDTGGRINRLYVYAEPAGKACRLSVLCCLVGY